MRLTDKDFQRFLKTRECWRQTCKNKNKQQVSEVRKKLKISEISLRIRQKAHPLGKCLLKYDNLELWSILLKKGGLRQKGKGPTKRFSYGLMSRNPQDQELEKFLFHLNSEGVCKTSGRKGGWQSFVALRQKESGWGLCLNWLWREKTGLTSKSTLISSLRGKTLFTHKWNSCNFWNSLVFTLFSCLSLRVKWIYFFFWISTNFSKYFGGVRLKSVLII